ncbi:TolC family protein [Planctomycetota bacterium]
MSRYYLESADRAAAGILESRLAKSREDKNRIAGQAWQQMQKKQEPPADAGAAIQNPPAGEVADQSAQSEQHNETDGKQPKDEKTEVQLLSLRDALEIATRHNRDYQTRQEDLILSALSLTGVRRNFGFILSGGLDIDGDWEDPLSRRESRSETLSLGINRILYTGANLSVTGSSTQDHDYSAFAAMPNSASSSLTISLSQPLLKGAGHKLSHESLTQAERSIIYDIREFEQFREDFTIRILQAFYDLVLQKQVIANQQNNLAQFEFLLKRTEALFSVGRATGVDVLRARREELQSKNDLLDRREAFETALYRFKIQLGLPVNAAVEIRPEHPQSVAIDIDLKPAIETALLNRVDYTTSKEVFEDRQRAYDIARNGLLPDLDLDASYSLSSTATPGWPDQKFENRNFGVGLSLELPLDRIRERNNLKSARISLDRARRSMELTHDNVIIEVRSSLRALRQQKNTLDIQKEIIASEKKRLKITKIRFQNGELKNRDVVEAQRALLNAENSYIAALVAFENRRIRLLRDLGILIIEPDGTWKEFDK